MNIVQLPSSYVTNIAETMIGIPFKHLGRNAEEGLDCWGMALEFYKRLGIDLNCSVTFYDEDWWKVDDLMEPKNCLGFFSVEFPICGDLACMCLNSSSVPNHVAIVLNKTYLLNTAKNIGIHKLRFSLASNLIISLYRYNNLNVI